jgi:hypothetical protein
MEKGFTHSHPQLSIQKLARARKRERGNILTLAITTLLIEGMTAGFSLCLTTETTGRFCEFITR